MKIALILCTLALAATGCVTLNSPLTSPSCGPCQGLVMASPSSPPPAAARPTIDLEAPEVVVPDLSPPVAPAPSSGGGGLRMRRLMVGY